MKSMWWVKDEQANVHSIIIMLTNVTCSIKGSSNTLSWHLLRVVTLF